MARTFVVSDNPTCQSRLNFWVTSVQERNQPEHQDYQHQIL